MALPPGDPSGGRAPRPATTARGVRVRYRWPRRRWLRWTLLTLGGLSVIGAITLTYLWISYAHLIDARLAVESQPIPRIFGQPFDIQTGHPLTQSQLVQRLNDVGYAQRPKAAQPGEFSLSPNSVQLITRPAEKAEPRTYRVDFTADRIPVVRRILDVQNKPVDHVTLEAPLLAAIAPGQKRRKVPLALIPENMKQAVLAIEDRRFYQHPGVDVIRAVGAIITNLRGNKKYLEGASTITQQVIKNTFLTPEQSLRRKLQEQFMALVLDSRFTKDQILELYLNEAVLGQRGPYELRGVGEAARVFFGKDVSNLSLAEAATIAGLLQQPSALSPLRHPDKARERRNVVLAAMAEAGFITADAAKAASNEPMKVATRAFEDEAPYFVDYVSKQIDEQYQGLMNKGGALDVYTTLDLHLQRMGQEAIAEGLVAIDKQLPKSKKGQEQVALIAIDPRSGEILAWLGGRSYNESQLNRVVGMRRQPGSTFKPFVYLAAFERTDDDHSVNLTPATIMVDEPTVFKDGDKDYAPSNYKDEYGGPMTLRRALALSRNIVTIKVAQAAGYDQVAQLWKKVDVGTPALAVPSIALGVFEASPIEMATAYTLFVNGGSIRPVQAISRIDSAGKVTAVPPGALRPIARPETTYQVLNMMRSVINEGTAASVRSAEYRLTMDLAGKTGTTNDQRDAWFVGFTPELMTIVWVGFDNNQPIGLSGAQAALPVWLSFMKRALAGRQDVRFTAPEGLSYVEIDPETGQLATPSCPKTITEAFLPGTEPHDRCQLHGGLAASPALKGFGSWLRRIIR